MTEDLLIGVAFVLALSVLTQRSCPGPGMGRGWGGMHKSGCSQGSSPDPEPSVGCPKATFGLVSTLPTQAAQSKELKALAWLHPWSTAQCLISKMSNRWRVNQLIKGTKVM